MSSLNAADPCSTTNSELEDIHHVPLLESLPDSADTGMTRSQAFNLYTTHFLSTWNVRTYEFAAASTDEVTKTRNQHADRG